MNHVSLSGNLTGDPEVRYLDGGKAVTNFSIAVHDRRGEKEYTSYFRCAAWGPVGVRVADTARRGTHVVLDGRLNQKTWKDKNSSTHDDVSVMVMNFYVTIKPSATAEVADQQVEDDLPF